MKIRQRSLQQKLTRVIMLTSGAALLVASIFFAVNDVLTLRESKVRDLRTLAQIIGANSQGALSFADVDAATTTLGGVRAKPHIIAGAIYKEGRVFAKFQRPGSSGIYIPPAPERDGYSYASGSLMLTAPVLLDADRIGTVYLQESTADITARLQRYAGVAALIIVGSALFAFLVSSRLQRIITDPILDLARTATAVSTEKNYAIRARKRTNDEIGVLIDSFNDMLGQIERNSAALQELNSQLASSEQQALAANQAKSAFLARMSHELRTPLNAIIGYSEMLQEEAEDLEQNEFLPDLQKINAAGKHLLALINDILDLSKVEAGKMDFFLEEFEVAPLVAEVRTTIQPLLEKNKNRLEVECPANVGRIRGDLTKIRQMLFNLLSNASKFTEGGRIGLSVVRRETPRGDLISFAVSDTGIGMTQEQVEKVFDAFVQADASTTRKYGGTGLGLAITQKFTQMMGGEITVRSEPGAGTTFTITIPAEISEAVDVSSTSADTVRPGTRATVLAIDDDPEARDLLKRFLNKEGFDVVTAASGVEGARLARELHPDVITLDVMMPGMDGWAVLSALKADPEVADIPVVVITMVDNRNIGYALGASDYLTKPLSRERLTAVLRKYVPRRNGSSVLVVDDDPGIRELLSRYLQGESCRVVEAENGRVALERMGQELPALILLDLIMPEMDGFEFVEQVREHRGWSSIPIIVITARDITNDDRKRLNGGVSRILQKGAYTREQLLTTVGALVAGNVNAPGGGAD